MPAPARQSSQEAQARSRALEIRKDFAHYRFDPVGGRVMEKLWEEGSVEG